MDLSGAMAAAAKSVAFQFHTFGYQRMIDKLDDDRKILVDNRTNEVVKQ